MRNSRRSLSWLLSWLTRPPTPGWGDLLPLGHRGDRQNPAPPRTPAPSRVDRPHIARQRLAAASCPYQRSLPVRVASGTSSAPSTLRVNTSNHPQRFKIVSPAWPTQPPSHYGSTRVSEEGCYIRCFYHSARGGQASRHGRQHKSEFATSCPDLREGRNSLRKIEVS